jgi:hypothetical protein
VLVFNADNCGTFSDPIESEDAFYHGVARFSVPDGHYWAIGQFINFSPKGLALRMPILPQFTVGANTAVHMSERAASSEVSVATPRPAITQSVSLAVVRTTPQSQLSISWTAAGLSLRVSPVAVRPAVGTLQPFTSAQLTSPPGPGISLRLQPGLRRSAGHDPSPALHSQRRPTGEECLVPLRYVGVNAARRMPDRPVVGEAQLLSRFTRITSLRAA